MRFLTRLFGAPVAAGALALAAAASTLVGAAPVAAATGPDLGISSITTR